MIKIVVICLLTIICILQFIILYTTRSHYIKLKNDFESVNASKYKYKNIYSMVEYYIRNYKEGKNPFTVLRDITDLVYRTGDLQNEREEDRT